VLTAEAACRQLSTPARTIPQTIHPAARCYAGANWAKIGVSECRFRMPHSRCFERSTWSWKGQHHGPRADEFVLSRQSPGAVQRRLALGVVLLLLVAFVIVGGPLSSVQLRRIDGLHTYLRHTDSITAALLFAQFSVLRSGALLALANGYLLTGLIAIPRMLTFPGVFAPGGGLGAGLESTVWLAILRYAGFALSAFTYTLLKDADPIEGLSQRSVRAVIIASVGSIAVLVCCATVLVTASEALLPRLMLDPVRGSQLSFYVVGPVATGS